MRCLPWLSYATFISCCKSHKECPLAERYSITKMLLGVFALQKNYCLFSHRSFQRDIQRSVTESNFQRQVVASFKPKNKGMQYSLWKSIGGFTPLYVTCQSLLWKLWPSKGKKLNRWDWFKEWREKLVILQIWDFKPKHCENNDKAGFRSIEKCSSYGFVHFHLARWWDNTTRACFQAWAADLKSNKPHMRSYFLPNLLAWYFLPVLWHNRQFSFLLIDIFFTPRWNTARCTPSCPWQQAVNHAQMPTHSATHQHRDDSQSRASQAMRFRLESWNGKWSAGTSPPVFWLPSKTIPTFSKKNILKHKCRCVHLINIIRKE